MAKFELFSTRQKKLRGEINDVYQYDVIGDSLKRQIIHIIKDTIGTSISQFNRMLHKRILTPSEEHYEFIRKILIKEYGEYDLSGRKDAMDDIFTRFEQENNIEICLDIIELTFSIIDAIIRENIDEAKFCGATQHPDDAIEELNDRFKAAGVGYEFISGEIIRIDSEFIHSEVVKPTLLLLQQDAYFEGTNEEFLSAHKHFRHKNYKETLVDCNKAFESCMKAICEKKGWAYKENDTSKALINICLTNNLLPAYMQPQINHFRGLLESGIPTVRNKEGGHGQGVEIKEVSQELASYVLHLTATNIVFLAKC